MRDVVVIGAGLAGLAATIRLADAGAKVTLVTRGIGGLSLGQGTVDILGYSPERVVDVPAAVTAHAAAHAEHPYGLTTCDQVISAVKWFADLMGPELLVGETTRNVLLPTAVGALRPTALIQPSMVAGVLDGRPLVVVGLRRLKDFPAALVADNLSKQTYPGGTAITARAAWVDLEIRPGEKDSSGLVHARAFDDPENLRRLAQALTPLVREGEVVALPAVLGLDNRHAWHDLTRMIGHNVFEIPLQPPSVPGMRLDRALTAMVKQRARLITGVSVVGHQRQGKTLTSVTVDSAGGGRTIEARHVLLAAGGFESAALELDSRGKLRDTVLDLPVWAPDGPLLHGDFWGPDQPLFRAGFRVDDQMRVLDEDGAPALDNVHAAGGNLRGATRWREKSGEGIALVSALRAADAILRSL
ncbi:glycerol-3-phosphate dehydrogenase subunit GlpB [Schaalia sp. 19OD2882]|uniref:glycerol-3-phosphate dehydrogenase subunit GlpB n=1 Tax=Schaalia sp. 19OD2882 TaxID=2794089 RepID=UPI001C1E95DB|nr:glycerol-3-phosphate dehydrogenase subunit GlpB [Schaalia sp. 19OD2882]QWW18851.1 glycerol-3-phosphate dehydrogenase subunit GlpB [Schaalia sp. 19OD2882]